MINPWEQKKIAGTLFGVVFAYIFAGALYTWFGAPYIEARENCLLQTAAAAEAEVPSGSVIVQQAMHRKLFRRFYTTQYICREDPERFLRAALNKLKAEGWDVVWLRSNALGLIGGVGLGLAVIAGWQWWQGQQLQSGMQASTGYARASEAFEAGRIPAKRLKVKNTGEVGTRIQAIGRTKIRYP